MSRRSLAVIIGATAHDRLHAALSLAAASAALGRAVFLYLHADAVRLVDPSMQWPEDMRFAAAGAPGLRELLDTAFELGITVTACQTGLALGGLSAEAIDQRADPGGLVDFLGRIGDAEIVLA